MYDVDLQSQSNSHRKRAKEFGELKINKDKICRHGLKTYYCMLQKKTTQIRML